MLSSSVRLISLALLNSAVSASLVVSARPAADSGQIGGGDIE